MASIKWSAANSRLGALHLRHKRGDTSAVFQAQSYNNSLRDTLFLRLRHNKWINSWAFSLVTRTDTTQDEVKLACFRPTKLSERNPSSCLSLRHPQVFKDPTVTSRVSTLMWHPDVSTTLSTLREVEVYLGKSNLGKTVSSMDLTDSTQRCVSRDVLGQWTF